MSARILPLSTLAACLWAAGCQQVEYQVDVHTRQDGAFDYAKMPDGAIKRDYASYEQAASHLVAEANEAAAPVSVRFLDDQDGQDGGTGTPLMLEPGQPRSAGPVYLPFGYAFTSGPLRTNVTVGGCVNGPTGLEYGLRLNRGTTALFDLQLATYARTGKRCFGAVENQHKTVNWCLCGSLPTPEQVRGTIYAASIGFGVSSGMAWLVAEVGTPLVLGALELLF